MLYFFFFFNDTATTEIYTLSLHDALPIWERGIGFECLFVGEGPLRRQVAEHVSRAGLEGRVRLLGGCARPEVVRILQRSEEHTSELQSRQYLVCRLLLEKKKIKNIRSLHI